MTDQSVCHEEAMARRGPRVSTEARREEILKAAYTCFSRGGYHATTIDDIALEAGLSKGAVYWHFEGKWELFIGLCDQLVRGLEEQLALPHPEMSARQRLEHACEIVLRSDPGGPGMAELQAEFIAHAARDPELRKRFAGMGQGVTRVLVDAVAHGVASGEFRSVDPEQAALAIIASLDGLQVHQVLRPELDVHALWRASVELLIRGMEAK